MQDISHIVEDEQFLARETIVKVEDEEWGTIRMPNIVPRFSRTPGEIRWSGLGIGRHQDEILAPAEEDS